MVCLYSSPGLGQIENVNLFARFSINLLFHYCWQKAGMRAGTAKKHNIGRFGSVLEDVKIEDKSICRLLEREAEDS